MSLDEQILQAIEATMPQGAEIDPAPVETGAGTPALRVEVSWKLNDDPDRPNKMSKTVSICLSREAAGDFAKMSAADQGAAYQRVSRFLRLRLATFDPRHDAPKDKSPPVETWVISSEDLRGGGAR